MSRLLMRGGVEPANAFDAVVKPNDKSKPRKALGDITNKHKVEIKDNKNVVKQVTKTEVYNPYTDPANPLSKIEYVYSEDFETRMAFEHPIDFDAVSKKNDTIEPIIPMDMPEMDDEEDVAMNSKSVETYKNVNFDLNVNFTDFAFDNQDDIFSNIKIIE